MILSHVVGGGNYCLLVHLFGTFVRFLNYFLFHPLDCGPPYEFSILGGVVVDTFFAIVGRNVGALGSGCLSNGEEQLAGL